MNSIQWFQMPHLITFSTIYNLAVLFSGARVSQNLSLVPQGLPNVDGIFPSVFRRERSEVTKCIGVQVCQMLCKHQLYQSINCLYSLCQTLYQNHLYLLMNSFVVGLSNVVAKLPITIDAYIYILCQSALLYDATVLQ